MFAVDSTHTFHNPCPLRKFFRLKPAHPKSFSFTPSTNHLHTKPNPSINWVNLPRKTQKRVVWAVKGDKRDPGVSVLADAGRQREDDNGEEGQLMVSDESENLEVLSSSAGFGGGRRMKNGDGDRDGRLISKGINAGIVLVAGSFAITKLLTIDHDYWHGWTLYEILRYAPEHNWFAYEEALKANPVLAKMMISGVVYSIGDWIAQCYEGKPLFDFDRVRMFRSGLVGFTLHGSLSHYYYQFCEALFPFQGWWVVPAKVAFDQTVWSAVWNSIYYIVLGFMRLESPNNIFRELKDTFWPMLTAGWKLWPFAHLITYGLIPVEQRLLWVDCVELIWVTILSTFSNEKSEARISEALQDSNSAATMKDLEVVGRITGICRLTSD